MIRYVEGDVLSTDARVIVHGCNARGAFGAGVAGAILRRYPESADAYQAAHKRGPLKLGAVIPSQTRDGKIILHAITQDRYGRPAPGVRFVDYDAVETSMKRVAQMARDGVPDYMGSTFTRIAMPAIGAGLGGGDWHEVCRRVEAALPGIDVDVYYLGSPPAGITSARI